MKIVISAGGAIWNESHPCLGKYGDDVLVMRHGSAAELIARIGEDRNVAVLTDNDPASFEVFDILAGAFKSRRIHLFACLPFTYESRRRKQEILDHLTDLDMVKSLCLVPLDGFLTGSSNGETLGSLQLRIRNDMMALLMQAAEQMEALEEFCQYRYDLESGSYAPCDFSGLAVELQMRLFAKRRKTEEQPERQNTGARSAAGRTVLQEENGTGAAETSAEDLRMPADRECTEPVEKKAPDHAREAAQEQTAGYSGKNHLNSGREPEAEIRIDEEETAEAAEGKTAAASPEMKEPAEKKRRNLFDFLRRKKV